MTDLPGQYDKESGYVKEIMNEFNGNLTMVIDCEKPKSLDSLIDNWLLIFLENKVIKEKLKGKVFNIYFSKAGTTESKIDFNSVIKGKYKSIHNNFPRTEELIKKIEALGYKTTVYVGDMDRTINSKQHQAEMYLIRTNDYLKHPVKRNMSEINQL
jgi:hypothetical protein